MSLLPELQDVGASAESFPGGGSMESNEAVLCAVTAKTQGGPQGLRLGLAVFDPKRPALLVAEINSDNHLTSLEAVLMQVNRHPDQQHQQQ